MAGFKIGEGFAYLGEGKHAVEDGSQRPVFDELAKFCKLGAAGMHEEVAVGDADGRDVGRNSYFTEGWLPADPPTGHGPHDYVFPLFALSGTPDIGSNPGRSEFVKAITGRVLGAGMLVGAYSRGGAAGVGLSVARALPA